MGPDGHWPKHICGDELWEKHREWEDEQKRKAWSDGKEHDKIYVSILRSTYKKQRGWRRLNKRLSSIGTKTYMCNGIKMEYIAVDEVQYAQGWFFKNRFFNKEITSVFCVTKEQMINFFNKYIDFNSKADDRGRGAVRSFLEAWEDGMIFECAW